MRVMLVNINSVKQFTDRYELHIIVTNRPIARQRLGKLISAGANAHNNRTSISRQQRGKHASSTIESVFSAWSGPRSYFEDS
jgi:hypothetical protein